MKTKRNDARAFLIHNERGEILGAAIPADPTAQCGVRAEGHCVSVVQIPEFDTAEKLDAHILAMINEFRVESANADRPAQLVRKPNPRK